MAPAVVRPTLRRGARESPSFGSCAAVVRAATGILGHSGADDDAFLLELLQALAQHGTGRRPVDDVAGRGILHQEMPKGDSNGRTHGFQLWVEILGFVARD